MDKNAFNVEYFNKFGESIPVDLGIDDNENIPNNAFITFNCSYCGLSGTTSFNKLLSEKFVCSDCGSDTIKAREKFILNAEKWVAEEKTKTEIIEEDIVSEESNLSENNNNEEKTETKIVEKDTPVSENNLSEEQLSEDTKTETEIVEDKDLDYLAEESYENKEINNYNENDISIDSNIEEKIEVEMDLDDENMSEEDIKTLNNSIEKNIDNFLDKTKYLELEYNYIIQTSIPKKFRSISSNWDTKKKYDISENKKIEVSDFIFQLKEHFGTFPYEIVEKVDVKYHVICVECGGKIKLSKKTVYKVEHSVFDNNDKFVTKFSHHYCPYCLEYIAEYLKNKENVNKNTKFVHSVYMDRINSSLETLAEELKVNVDDINQVLNYKSHSPIGKFISTTVLDIKPVDLINYKYFGIENNRIEKLKEIVINPVVISEEDDEIIEEKEEFSKKKHDSAEDAINNFLDENFDTPSLEEVSIEMQSSEPIGEPIIDIPTTENRDKKNLIDEYENKYPHFESDIIGKQFQEHNRKMKKRQEDADVFNGKPNRRGIFGHKMNLFENKSTISASFKRSGFAKLIQSIINIAKDHGIVISELNTESYHNPNVDIHYNIVIDSSSYDIPMVDFSTGIRLVCRDIDNKSMCFTPIKVERKTKFSYYYENFYKMFPVYSDTVENTTKCVASANILVKWILGKSRYNKDAITSVFNNYDTFYVTECKDQTREFDYIYSPDLNQKASSREIGLVVSEKTNEKFDITRLIHSRGIDKLNSLNMYMVATIKFYLTKDSPNNIKYHITSYNEIANTWIEDGFELLTYAILKEHYMMYQSSSMAQIFYNFDRSSLPSPSVLSALGSSGNLNSRAYHKVNSIGMVYNKLRKYEFSYVKDVSLRDKRSDFGRFDPRMLSSAKFLASIYKGGGYTRDDLRKSSNKNAVIKELGFMKCAKTPENVYALDFGVMMQMFADEKFMTLGRRNINSYMDESLSDYNPLYYYSNPYLEMMQHSSGSADSYEDMLKNAMMINIFDNGIKL